MKPTNSTATAASSLTNLESSILRGFEPKKPKAPIELLGEIRKTLAPTWRERAHKWLRKQRMEHWGRFFQRHSDNSDFRTLLLAVAGWIATVEKRVIVKADELQTMNEAVDLCRTLHQSYGHDQELFMEVHRELAPRLEKLFPEDRFETLGRNQ